MNSNYRIFICTHKDIPFDYKKIGVNKKHYTIISQVKGVESDVCDVIDTSDDEFVKKNKIGYSELTAIHYLYTHQELIKDLDYIGICHYRRFYLDLMLNGAEITEDIVTVNNRIMNHTNYREYDVCHCKAHIDMVWDIVNRYYTDYADGFRSTMNSNKMHHCNMVILPKNVFLEYCEFLFGVLGKFDEQIGVTNDTETSKYVNDNFNLYGNCTIKDMSVQVRLQGLLAERLTDAFIREKEKTYSIHESKMMKLFVPDDFKNVWEGALPIRNSK